MNSPQLYALPSTGGILYTRENVVDNIEGRIKSVGYVSSLKKEDNTLYKDILCILSLFPEVISTSFIDDIRIVRGFKDEYETEYKTKRQFFTEFKSFNIRSLVFPSTSAVLFTKACFSAIEPQLLKFSKSEDGMYCELCGVSKTESNLRVGHVSPKFKTLVDEFVDLLDISGEVIPQRYNTDINKGSRIKSPDTSRVTFKKEDREVETWWELYHNREANLRMLCAPCERKADKLGI